MKTRLYETKELVKQVLEENERTRNSDNELYIEICYRINPHVMYMPFADVLSQLAEFSLPPFESVRRARQKLQAENPDLRPCDEVALFRAENETAYQEFATN